MFCPEGEVIIHNQILPTYPNAVILAYHGAGNDPFRFFNGNNIMGLLGLNAYPTATIDRTSGILSRSAWTSTVGARNTVPATVQIEVVNRSYDAGTRQFSGDFDFTALQNLSGDFRYTVLLVEDGIVYPQAGSLGGANYVHDWTVRDIMNGATGELLSSGTWTANQAISKSISYTVPVPQSPAPDIVPDNCKLVVMVHQVGSPLNSGAEIQQAIQIEFISPDFVATVSSEQFDYIGANTSTAQNTMYIHNIGLMSDTYNLSMEHRGPVGWVAEFTTPNGTFSSSQTDQVTLAPGDSVAISIAVAANGVDGYAATSMKYVSVNNSGNAGRGQFRFTTLGMDYLVVDDDAENTLESYVVDELTAMGKSFGIAAGSLIPDVPAADLQQFEILFWNVVSARPTVTTAEQGALAAYLEGGGALYINGLDIAYELGDPASPYYSQASADFLSDQLGATYVAPQVTFLLINGVSGDPITDGMDIVGLFGGTGANTIDPTNGKYANQIGLASSNSDAIFNFYNQPDKQAGIRAAYPVTGGTARVVFTTFGFETIAEATIRSQFLDRMITWMENTTVGIDDPTSAAVSDFRLEANYPNPFNPQTAIEFSVPVASVVTLEIFDISGRHVKTLHQASLPVGHHKFIWDATDASGNSVASGVYFYRMRAVDFVQTRKMMLLR